MPEILLPQHHKSPAADGGPSLGYFTLLNSWDGIQSFSITVWREPSADGWINPSTHRKYSKEYFLLQENLWESSMAGHQDLGTARSAFRNEFVLFRTWNSPFS